MPSSMYYAYNPAKPLSIYEQEVKAKGFPFVSTTTLGPGGRLHEHHHSSVNTHLIISGSIVVAKSRDSIPRFRAQAHFPGAMITLPKEVDYIGEAGPEGCIFVEGHTVLSPTTAARFLERGKIVKVKEGSEESFTTSVWGWNW